MDTKERENFNRNSTLIVEHTKNGLTDLIDLNVTLGVYGSFENFINDKQHEIYHLCYNRSRCCQCPLGYTLPSARVLHPSQLELLLSKIGPKKMCHNQGRTGDFCCCAAHRGLTTIVLDVTLARCLLVNFCQDVFWYSCLTAQKQTLEDFLTHNKHDIYHLYDINSRCCQCPLSYVVPTQRPAFTTTQWNQLFSTSCPPYPNDTNRVVSGTKNVCSSSVTTGIRVAQLGADLSQILIEHCCPLRKSVEKLVQLRNNVFGHVKEAKISDNDDAKYRSEIDPNLLLIAQICCKESEVQEQLNNLDTRTLDGTLLLQTIKEQLYTAELLSGQMSEESSNVKEEITTRMAQATTDIKTWMAQETMEIKTRMAQETAENKTRIVQETTEIKTKMAQESAEIKEEITTRMAQESAEIKEEITTRIAQESAEIKEEITTRMAQESAEMKGEITTRIVQEIAEIKDEITTKMAQHIDGRIKDISTTLSSQVGQDTVKQQIEEKRKKLLEKTENLIKTHTNENTFVHTNAVNKALECVEENRIVILIGPPGIGKSRIGLELLRQISLDIGRSQSIQLDDISQWQDMSDDMDAVFIDDVFGRTNCSYNDNIHSKLLEMIFTTIQNKNVKVIITLRNNIYRTIATITERHRIFNDQHVLDLSSDKNQMTVKEKKSCLMNYLTKNKILKTDDINKENIDVDSILDTTTTVYLHEGTLQKILHSDIGTQIGFPETCYLFASHRKFIKQGHNFFCHPTEHLLNEIDNLRLAGDTNKRRMIDFTLLVYILLNGDSVNIYEIDLGAFRTMMGTIYLNPLANIPTSYFNDSTKRLSGKYLKINNEGNYCFQHRLISEAVMISFSFTDPRRVIPLLGFDFITEMARPQCCRPGEGEVIFPVPVSCYSLLAQRLLQLLDTDYKEEPYLFIQNLCKSKIITMTDTTVLQEMITQYKYKSSHHSREVICDHRFSGWFPYYFMNTSDFYLPSALMMFCSDHSYRYATLVSNIGNKSVYQCLYDRLHNTLTSESDSEVMEACQETVVTAFNFAVCTLDVKRSTVILKILTNHNIKQVDLGISCHNIVKCQGLPAVQLMLSLHDLSHVFNITSLLSKIFWLFTWCKINIDDNMKQFIKSVIVNNNHDMLPVRYIVMFVCRRGQLDFVKDVCEIFDSSLLNVDDLIIKPHRDRNTEVIQWLIEKYHGLYNVQRVLNDACSYGYIEVVRIILDKCDHTLLDMKTVMHNACSSGNTELVKWLCEKFDNNLFYMKSVMNNACNRGNTELVKWLCEMFDNNLFDMKTAMNNACSSWNTELVKWLCETFDNNLFGMKTAMNNTCSKGNTELVKWLCEKFDNNLFDMKTAMNNVCSSGDTGLVKWLCEKFDNNLFDMKTAMNNACSRRNNTVLVKWLCERFDNNLFDMKTAMNNVCSTSWGNTELVKWLCEMFDNNLFDMKTAMNNASGSIYNTELVKWLCEKFASNLFDMKTVMNNACSSYNIKLVKWLCEKFDNNLFDMKTAINIACSSRFNTELVKWLCENSNLFDMKTVMNKACRSGNIELVKWLCKKFDNNLFDMGTAMNNACSSGNTELVKWLCEKFDNNFFGMKTAMNIACKSRYNTRLVKWLCEKFDNNLFDMKTVMNNACSSGNTELVKWLCEKFDNNFFDIKTAMNIACKSRYNTRLVKWLCEKFDNNLFDMKTVMNNACSSGNTELVKWLCENSNLFDMKTVMNKACRSGNIELVKWLCKKFDNNVFDMGTAMNNACSSGNTELVKWLCEKFDNNFFDMKTAMNIACKSRYNNRLVKWLCEKFDNNLFDMKTVMNNACSSGNTELLKWLCEKVDNNLFDMNEDGNELCM